MEKADNAALNKPNQSDTNINTKETMLLLYVNDIKMECEYDDCEPDKVYIPQTITGENDIKQEPCDTNDSVETNIVHLPEIVNCGDSIKQEEEFIPSNTEACFVDDKVIVQETVFLSHVKKESNEDNGNLCCGKCNEEYNLYCTRCPMLTRILDNHVPNVIENRSKNTLPEGILDIRQTFLEVGVFALKVIPEDVIFGPFEGLDSVPSTAGSTWKLKGGKLVYPENSERLNWMHYVKYVPQSSDQNLLVFQYQDRLYYRSTRKIHDGEELLVYYCEEQANTLEDGVSETYLHPIVAKEFKDVFACTYCCVGYGLEEDLLKHQLIDCSKICAKTPVEGIVQCSLCKIYMDKREHSEYHMKHCWERNSSQHQTMPIADQGAEFLPRLSTGKQLKCTKCKGLTPCRRHKKNRRHIERRLQCNLCNEIFTRLENLKEHLRLAHPFNRQNKPFRYSECSNKTLSKLGLDKRLQTPDNVKSKQFECNICKKRFHLSSTLKKHLENNCHDEVETVKQPKKFKCLKCPYETDARKCLIKHFNIHSEDKPFNCNVCFRGFTSISRLNAHVKHIHPENNVKRYRCYVCGYETNDKNRLKQHVRIHQDGLKFKCELCEKEFNQKSNVKVHMKTVHGESKEFKCSKCKYETNRKDSYIQHTLTHDSGIRFTCKLCNLGFSCRADVKVHDSECHSIPNDTEELFKGDKKQTANIKTFQCKICPKQFSQKSFLMKHIKDTHEEKTLKCPRPHCSYKTSRAHNLRRHLPVHDRIQKYECYICKVGYSDEERLNKHNQRKHPVENDVKEIVV